MRGITPEFVGHLTKMQALSALEEMYQEQRHQYKMAGFEIKEEVEIPEYKPLPPGIEEIVF